MLTKRQIVFYEILVGAMFLFGVIMFFLMAHFMPSDDAPEAIVALLGGYMLAGLANGGILFGRFLKKSHSTALNIISAVLFLITFEIVSLIGLLTFIPSAIYHTVLLFKARKMDDLDVPLPVSKKSKSWLIVLAVSSVILLSLGLALLSAHFETKLDNTIAERTGYSKNSVDFLIAKNYFYDKNDPNCFDDMEYHYIIHGNRVFTLIKSDEEYDSPIFFVNRDNTFTEDSSYYRSATSSNQFLQPALDALFTSVFVGSTADSYTYKFTIDARTDAEHLKAHEISAEQAGGNSLGDTQYSDAYAQAVLAMYDSLYAKPKFLKLYDSFNQTIPTLISNDGHYAVYGDVVVKNDNAYKLTADYQGETFTVFYFDEIDNWLLTKSVYH